MRIGTLRRRLLAPFALLLLAAAAHGQPARLVRDLDTIPDPETPLAIGPRAVTALGSRALFFTGAPADYEHPSDAIRLWAADGDGVALLATVCSGSCVYPSSFVATTPGLAWFFAPDPTGATPATRLWRSDGTRAGTLPFWPQSGAGDFTVVLTFESRLYFGWCASGAGCGLWSSDGTTAGTRQVSAVAPIDLAVMGERLFFLGSDGRPGLFVLEGRGPATRRVASVAPGYLWLLTATSSRLFFMTGEESGNLWTSDGTPEGTHHVETFPESSHEFLPRNTEFLLPRGDRIVFLAGPSELWTTDGTARSLRRASRLCPVRATSASPADFAFVPGGFYFVASDGVTGDRLWFSGGTPETTHLITGCPGGCPTLSSARLLPLAGGRVLFSGQDPAHGAEPWVSDGTGVGTHLLRDLCPGPCGSAPRGLRRAGEQAVFAADIGGSSGASGTGAALYVTDGTAQGTEPLGPLAPPGADSGNGTESTEEIEIAVAAGRFFFAGFDAVHGRQLWTSDGTARGTRLLTAGDPPAPSSQPQDLAALGGRLLFTAFDGFERRLWMSAPGEAPGAAPLLPPGALGAAGVAQGPLGPLGLTVAGRYGFFFAGTGSDLPSELWRSDGTPDGTIRLASFAEHALSLPLRAGDRFFFVLSSTAGEVPLHTLWESDGTAAGTVKRLDLPDDALRVARAETVGDDLFLVVHRERSVQLFESDGTAAGTRLVYTFDCQGCGPEIDDVRLARLGADVYFTANVNDEIYSGLALYRTDGTEAGTLRLLPAALPLDDIGVQPAGPLTAFGGDLYYLAYSAQLDTPDFYGVGLFRGVEHPLLLHAIPYDGDLDLQLTPVAGRLFFRAKDPEHGVELWATDGSAAGTRQVSDLVPGSGSSDPRGLAAAGGRIFFSAWTPEQGRELWQSDGTAEGTRRVQDIAPGGASSSPATLTEVDGNLFFTADDGLTGRELWSLPLAAVGAGCLPTATRLCLGAFAVEAKRRDGSGALSDAIAVALSGVEARASGQAEARGRSGVEADAAPSAGLFTFGDPGNPELAVRILDTRSTNGHVGVVYGALTTEELTITVTDTATGTSRRYFKPPGVPGSAGDRLAFGPQGAHSAAQSEGPRPGAAQVDARAAKAAAGAPCVSDATTLCLQGGRFSVHLKQAANASATTLAGGQAGTFAFPGSPGPDLIVKVLDGRAVGGHFWLFFAGLTDAPYTLAVTDTTAGKSRTYTSPQGRFSARADTRSF
jgi:ELWxxDGT repeat protein